MIDYDVRYLPLRFKCVYQFVASFLPPNGFVLDAGCCTGYGTSILSKKASKTVGVDIEFHHLKKAAVGSRNCVFLQMDVTKLAFSEKSFHAFVSFHVIEHLHDPRVYLQEAKRVLKPGGVLAISTPNRALRGSSFNPEHVQEYNFVEFRTLIEKHFPKPSYYGLWGSPRVIAMEQERIFISSTLYRRILEALALRLKKKISTRHLNRMLCAALRKFNPDTIRPNEFEVKAENPQNALDLVAILQLP